MSTGLKMTDGPGEEILSGENPPAPKQPLLQNGRLAQFKQDLGDAQTPDQIAALFNQVNLGITSEHFEFLKNKGGARKLREFFYEVVLFDLTYGTNTSQFITEKEFHDAARDHPEHFANPDSALHTVRHRSALTRSIEDGFREATKLIETYGFNPEESVAYDVGCGVGKPALIASSSKFDCRFKRAVGFDNYIPLLNIAEQNKKALRIPSKKLEFVNADATRFTDYAATSVLWVYNPFDEEILDEFRKRVEANAKRAVIIYNKPRQAQIFESAANWKRERFQIGHHDPDAWTEDKVTIFFTYGMDRSSHVNVPVQIALPVMGEPA